jgi:ligand-binding sensor domain-containing protein/two-component sensor histidine kinase
MKKILLYFAFIISGLPNLTEATLTVDDYLFKQLTVRDGLSQSGIRSILQDSKGFLWFGTGNGLNKFDGYSFTVYLNDENDSTSLSDNGISALFEDKEGNIWIGTVGGTLHRLDRTKEEFIRFELNYNPDFKANTGNVLNIYPIAFARNSNSSITSITEDKNGNLWIGTWGNGLFRFNKKTKSSEHFYYDSKDNQCISSNRITKVFADEQGAVWIGTFGGGLNRLITVQNGNNKSQGKYSFRFIQFKNNNSYLNSISSNDIISIFEDASNQIWIGTYNGGLNKLSKEQKYLYPSEAKFTRYSKNSYSKPYTLPHNSIMAIIEDEEDLWLGTLGGGLIKFNHKTGAALTFKHDPLNDNSLTDNEVISLLKDKSGIIWIGTSLGRGISQLQINNRKFNHLRHIPSNPNTLSDNVVWAINEDKEGYLWFGTYRGGLNRYDKSKDQFKVYKNNPNDPSSLPDNHIRTIAIDNSNNLWVGCFSSGLNMFDRKTGKFINFINSESDDNSIGANQVLDIHIENDSIFWVATYGGGLNKFVLNSISGINSRRGSTQIKFKRYTHDPADNSSLSDNRVYTVFQDKEGNLWVGTFGGGLNKFDRKKENFIRFRHDPNNSNSISSNNILSIFQDSEGVLWIGTNGGGLNIFDNELNRFTRFNELKGLLSRNVYGILEDNNKDLWMSTDNGIFKYNRQTGFFTQYDINDGLQSLEFSGGAYFKSKSGEMFFGGINGINHFFPDSIRYNTYMPEIVISSFKIFNNRVKGEINEITLDHTQNFFSFEFASLDYSSPDDNQYAYMLEGFDGDWHYTDANRRMVTYTNLPPGKYVFKVIGSNNDGVWNYEGASVSLVILPPFWQTWWFIAACLFAILFFVYYLSTIRIRSLLAVEKLKTKLAADLHDSIGSGLTEISILSELAARDIRPSYEASSQNLKTISETARKLVDNMSDIVWVVNPKRDSLHDLIVRLKDSYNEILSSMGISMKTANLNKLESIKLPMEYKQNLYLIFKEGINNSIKHSKCSRIDLETNLRGDVLEMVLKDNGIGMEGNAKDIGNGLRNMVSRAESIGGKLKWKSTLNNGTTVIFVGNLNRINKIAFFFKKLFNGKQP